MLLLQRSDSSVAELAKAVVEKKQVPDIIGLLCFVCMQLSHEVYYGIAYLYAHSEYMNKEYFLDSDR